MPYLHDFLVGLWQGTVLDTQSAAGLALPYAVSIIFMRHQVLLLSESVMIR